MRESLRSRTPTSFFSFPLELRESIIELVLLEEHPPPTYSAAASAERYADFFGGSRDRNPAGCVRYEHQAPRSNAAVLIATNRQLRLDTQSVLARLYPHGIDCKLDVLFVNDYEVWPTWLHIPAPSDTINRLDVTCRVSGTVDGYQYHDSFPRHNVTKWSWYSLLNRFFHYGFRPPPDLSSTFSSFTELSHRPELSSMNQRLAQAAGCFSYVHPEKGLVYQRPEVFVTGKRLRKVRIEDEQQQHRMTVHSLNLNIELGDNHIRYEDVLAEDPTWRPARWAERHGNIVVSPRGIGDRITAEFAWLIGPDYHQPRYGSYLPEQLGRFKMSIEGASYDQVDITEVVCTSYFIPQKPTSPYTNETFGHIDADLRILAFWDWKYRAFNMRNELGFMDVRWADARWPSAGDLRLWREQAARILDKRVDPGKQNSWIVHPLCSELQEKLDSLAD